jgi:glycosyltransferase involved in cell wall biosynthesis
VREVILVGDAPQAPIKGVRFLSPPRWLLQILGRAGAKFVWMLGAGLRYRPDLYMGYHIMPGACSALMVARLFGRPACYQMTGGPIEIEGGGIGAENALLKRLGRPSAMLERLALRVLRQFDVAVVRGSKAHAFVSERGFPGTVAIITGSVAAAVAVPASQRRYDLVYVGRLTELKQPLQFVEIAAAVRLERPDVRAAVVGDGPMADAMKARAAELGVAGQVDFLGQRADVSCLLAASKVLVLTSRSEGLSIAMAEAMAAGAVPVVADVGELGDLVENGVNGYLVEPDSVDQYAARVSSLLRDPALWTRCSQAAAAAAMRHCGVDAVTALWRRHLDETIQRAAGHPAA